MNKTAWNLSVNEEAPYPVRRAWDRNRAARAWGLALVVLWFAASEVRAQWKTESFHLKAGWNAIFTHVDASHTTLDAMIVTAGNPIQEVWLWAPSPSMSQFITSPQEPTGNVTPWVSWTRAVGPAGLRLLGNATYLVRVDSGTAAYTWNVTGKPVPPRYQWTSKGLNFIGFSTVPSDAPTFESFLAKVPEFAFRAEILRYPGGELGPGNPHNVTFLKRTTRVNRGEAFWVRAQDYFNRYFNPYELELQNPDGVEFGDELGQHRIRLRNLTDTDLTVTVQLIDSEAAPAGQAAIAGPPPLVTRGELNMATLQYDYAGLSGPQSWTLKPSGTAGSEMDIYVGLKRSALTGNAGDLYAAVLRFRDSLGCSQVDVPVSAEVASTSGLWVGAAVVNQVRSYLKSYQTAADGGLVTTPDGSYVPSEVNTEWGAVTRPFSLRMIIHNDTSGSSRLLQRVYFGNNPANETIITTKESLLDPKRRAVARRISATHLPFGAENTPWLMSGQLSLGGELDAVVPLAYSDHGSNPFLHTYHPDHDNLNATFTAVRARGEESFDVVRQIHLAFTPPDADDFASVTGGSQNLSGIYSETVTFFGKGTESRSFEAQGVVVLNRISSIPALATE